MGLRSGFEVGGGVCFGESAISYRLSAIGKKQIREMIIQRDQAMDEMGSSGDECVRR